MGQHHSLGCAGRARGVDHRDQVPGPRPPGFGEEVVHGGVVAPGKEVFPRYRPVPARRPVEDDDVHGVVQARSRFPCLFELLRVRHEDQRRAAVAEDVRDLGRGEGAVDRHIDRTRADAGPVGQRPLHTVLRQDRHAISAPDSRPGQRRRTAPRLVPDLGVGEGSRSAVGHACRKAVRCAKEEIDQGPLRNVGRGGKEIDGVGHIPNLLR